MSDRTLEFRRCVEENKKFLPEVPRQRDKKQWRDRDAKPGSVLSTNEYMTEAYAILNHITTLSRMLSSIRRQYLDIDSRSFALNHSPRTFGLEGTDEAWSSIRYLSNEERDQIDLQARVILSRCADRVKEMEELEKRRSKVVASRSNTILKLLPTRLVQDATAASSDFVAAHHTGITWYLSRRLAEVGKNQKEMQEERIKRQMERAKTLGSGATREVLTLGMEESHMESQKRDKSRNWLEGVIIPSGIANALPPSLTGSNSGIGSSRGTVQEPTHQPTFDEDDGMNDDDVDELDLTPSQIIQFESENANLLRSVQDVLASVQLAESRLLDISALQMELVAHLTRQTEVTDQLYEDAIATSAMVDKGNTQLREARRRAKDGRMFILIFLVGASLALLFVHLY